MNYPRLNHGCANGGTCTSAPITNRTDVTDAVAPFAVHGVVDRDGRLVAADQPLLQLQLQAGGDEGGALAIPQVAALARLSQSLGLLVSRTIVAASGDGDLDLTVQAQPDGALTRLVIEGWRERAAVPASAALRLERARYYAAAENDGSWACDGSLRLTDVAPSLAKAARQSAERIVGEPMLRFFRLIEDDDGDLPIVSALATRDSFFDQPAELCAAPEIGLRLHGEPRFDSSGTWLGYAGRFSLVGGANGALRALLDIGVSTAEAEPFGQQLDSALRAPINRIIASADEINAHTSGPIRQDYSGYAADISSAGRHLLGLIDDISDMQAVEQEDFRASAEMVDLADIARRAAGLLKVRAADQSVRIDVPPLGETIDAKGDFRRVLQIIVNLLSNAVRYSPPGSSVWIRSEVDDDLAAVIVADQGKGIAKADQARIFEKFERIDPNEPGGTGLGLYISRRLARAMGGDINVDSAPGQGCRFVLTLPRG